MSSTRITPHLMPFPPPVTKTVFSATENKDATRKCDIASSQDLTMWVRGPTGLPTTLGLVYEKLEN